MNAFELTRTPFLAINKHAQFARPIQKCGAYWCSRLDVITCLRSTHLLTSAQEMMRKVTWLNGTVVRLFNVALLFELKEVVGLADPAPGMSAIFET
ncbi:MAG: hypothetical protein U0936_27130 [Planctomycetaceae bacterium]